MVFGLTQRLLVAEQAVSEHLQVFRADVINVVAFAPATSRRTALTVSLRPVSGFRRLPAGNGPAGGGQLQLAHLFGMLVPACHQAHMHINIFIEFAQLRL